MQPPDSPSKGFRGIRDGLGRDEITLDLERLADGANLIAIVGANGSGKSTIMDCLTPFMGLPSRARWPVRAASPTTTTSTCPRA